MATIGLDAVLSQRLDALRKMPAIEMVGMIAPDALSESLEGVDALFIGVPRAERFRIADEALRSGVHLFLEWPPATSIRECAALVRLAEEAGLECGVSRPLRFSPIFDSLRDGRRPNVISVTMHGDVVPANFAGAGHTVPKVTNLMADAVDLSCSLAGSSNIRRVDAEAARNDASRADAAAFSLRFHSGAYAQVLIRLDEPTTDPWIFAAGEGVNVEGRVKGLHRAIGRETQAFLASIARNRPAPVSALDALHAMRIVERIQELLR